MRYDEFLTRVRERGEYYDQEEAAHITRAVLGVLGHRVAPGEAADLARLLPSGLGELLAPDGDRPAEGFGIEEFQRRVGMRTGPRPRTAEWDATAVLTTLAEMVPGEELDRIVGRLPDGYAALFGMAASPD
ncbi:MULTISPECIES: DUF2267 domain-containing protein [Streptomyces]|uniref:DUF2267 domain-containing protein n=2 Tax=Streptomyces TaxID=1883 RepID=A0A1D8G8W8_9ACTN|nr:MULTISPECIES: DUF2267 domain-containing protein [Streptomyces]AOT61891.1 hypothetical protein A4G23_04782 [Streptomyces rubrolavendulae]KAF0649936.1 hypothetical protein K701_11115 [Streptomyces fradiae ATCC 10745 = DSM 40063]OSY51035.1 hypothetical protein BG846_03343 [Streptomyces fradiae ATCC 10745 = DSM 40063]QEV14787.1 DUF2267 domain-containing protein [Streptomyces fradiae ATCC 10745 = DSM 40063]UQS32894.1 DUF2267 domain-containing protein [Streptomyces fradiae]